MTPTSRRTSTRSALAALALAAALSATAAGSAQAATASSATQTKTVSYRGHQFRIPLSWPVVDLSAHPTSCVRFDQHALYLGTPGADQNCPANVFGHTEALLVEPATNNAAGQGTTDQSINHQYLTTAADIQVTATYDTDKQLVRSILASAALPTTAPTTRPQAAPRSTASSQAVAANATNYTGKGFDACAAPSAGSMSTWKADSPYGAVGIYIGGADRGCSQPNLTSSWVQQQASAGWHFMPLYAGLQARAITSPTSDGTAAADDAVAQAQSLGFAAGTPLYYDMEDYSHAYSSTVLSYLSAWSKELHAKGYNSGVYSSSSSGITDVVNSKGSGYAQPDVLFDANWNGVADTNDPVIPSGDWAQHQRVHQYTSNVQASYGGVSIPIDQDYLDVSLSVPSPPAPAPALGDKGSVLGLGTSPTAYTFTRDALTGHLQVTTLGPGGWATKDLTSSVGTPVSAGGAPAAFVQQGGTVGAVTADAANGHLQITYLSTAGAWATADLTGSVGTPVTGGALSTAIAPDGTLYIFSRDSGDSGDLSATYLSGTGGGWATADMTTMVGTPASAGGAPSTFLQSNGTLGVVTGDAANGHLQITYLPKGGAWATSDLTASVGTPVTGGYTSNLIAPDGTLYIFSRGSTNGGHLSATYLNTSGTWATADMTNQVGTPASAGGAPSTFLQTNGTLGVATADSANGHLQITYLPKGGNWATSDLTTQAGTPVTGGALSAMTDADGTLAIYSIGSTNNGDVQLTYLPTNGTWTTVSMTTTAGTPHAG
ncbi:hypothetical protein ABIA33_004705 [Streptacidiphilus sp. MAP12-16]|uniref:glycoside hydrolase domain-containing protein n=1 Tax=Streptacidiphilus sp. MAP12-16 TaxID=3156300 RepID=UPI0035155DC0